MNDKKLIFSITIGSMLEIFDFISFAFLASIITIKFFPAKLHNVATIFTYLTITASYLMRPIGGLILAHLGDKYGRKSMFILSVMLMSIPSFVIGLLPTFESLGYFATSLMIFARILQGFSVGGEVPGSITYVAEKFHKNPYLYCAWLTFGANIGVAFGAQLIHLLIKYTTHEFMYSIGWRIPFIFGGLLAIVGIYIRKNISETEEFKNIQQIKQISAYPLVELFRRFKAQIICGIILSTTVSLMTSIFHVFLPNLFISYFNLDINISSNISSIGAVTMGIGSVIFGYLTKYIKWISILRVGLIGLIVIFIVIISQAINISANNVYILYLLTIIISIALSCINGVFFGILANLFPTQVRFSGVASCYNIAYLLGAGMTPLWAVGIIHFTHDYKIIIEICLIATLIGLINTIYLAKQHSRDISK